MNKSRIVNSGLDAIHDLLIATGNLLDGAKLILGTNTGDLDTIEETADIEVPTFGGYAAAVIAAWTKVIKDNGDQALSGGAVVDISTNDTGMPMSITTWALTDAADALICVGKFLTPIMMTHSGQQYYVAVEFPLTRDQEVQAEAGTV